MSKRGKTVQIIQDNTLRGFNIAARTNIANIGITDIAKSSTPMPQNTYAFSGASKKTRQYREFPTFSDRFVHTQQ